MPYFFRRPILMALALYGAGILTYQQFGFFDRVPPQDPSHWEGERAALTGIVAAHPDPRPTGCVYLIQAEVIEIFSETHPRHALQGQLLLHVMKSTVPFAVPGERVRFVGRLQKPKPSLTPGSFDYQEYLANQNVHAIVYTGPRSVENLGPTSRFRWTRFGWMLKQKGISMFHRHLPKDQATVLSGLVLGSRPRFDSEIKRIFVESGTMHVLVASGSNVAFVIALWFLFLRLFRVPYRWALGSSIPSVWLYVLLAGADAPIVRAGLMGTIGVIAYLLNREDRPYQALGMTAFILLLINPRFLFDIGFRMSFVTVFGLIYFLTPIEKIISEKSWWVRWPVRLAAATVTAQIWLVPITAATFQRFFPIGVLANIVVVPLSALGFISGILIAAAEAAPFLTTPIIFCVRHYLSGFITVVRFFAVHPGTSIWVSAPHPLWSMGFYIACFSVVGIRRSLIARLFFLTGILLLVTGWIVKRHQIPRVNSLTATWIDNGKRLSTLIETKDGKRILINPGPLEPVDTTERVLMPFLTERGIRSLDAVIITDPDPMHTAGVKSLVKWVHVSTVVVCAAPFLDITDGKNRVLIADVLKLKAQDYLLVRGGRNFQFVQAHFPPNWKWRKNFVERFRPKLVVESNMVSDYRPSFPPWEKTELIAPQNLGWYRWEAKKN